MSVTAKFLADFSDFQSAVAKAEVSLKSFESGAGKVETALNKMADSFSGRKIIQDAELAAKAVTDIGGATKLTETEQARLNSLLTEAIAKYAALGLEAPPSMKALASETAGATVATKSMLGTLGQIAGAVGIGFSIGAVVNFGKSVFDSASKIGDLSKQLGVSTDAVQGFQFAAEQSGSSLDAVGTAITKMNQHLSAGDSSTVKALQAAGIAFDDIRQLQPEDAFLRITDAIEQIPDPMKQTEVALQLFGKGAAELLPAIKEGFRSVSDGAHKMSAETIASLKRGQDAWNEFGRNIVIITGNLLVSIADVSTATAKAMTSLKGFGMFLENAFKFGPGMAAAMADLAASATKAAPPLAAITNHTIPTAFTAHAKAVKSAAEETASLKYNTEGLHGELNFLGQKLQQLVIPKMADFGFTLNYIDGIPFGKHIGEQIDLVPPKVKVLKADFGDLARALADLAQVSGSTFGGMVSQLSTLVASAAAAQKSIELMKKSASPEEKGTLTGFLDMAAGITGIVSAAIAAGKAVAALFGLFDRNKGRDLVVDFAETFGGFDALHEKLLTLGDAGEALWIKLTQGVGRNNPQQAQQAIDEVTAALAKQEAQHDDTTSATEEQAQATIETASEAAKALDDLGLRIKTNEDEWAEWSKLVMGDIDAVAASLRSLQLPNLPFSAGTSAGSSGGGSSAGGGTAVLEVDGQTWARVMVPHIAEEVRRTRLS